RRGEWCGRSRTETLSARRAASRSESGVAIRHAADRFLFGKHSAWRTVRINPAASAHSQHGQIVARLAARRISSSRGCSANHSEPRDGNRVYSYDAGRPRALEQSVATNVGLAVRSVEVAERLAETSYDCRTGKFVTVAIPPCHCSCCPTSLLSFLT